MINRILIRIKVIQLLYSYLLVEQHFSLEPIGEPVTREKRFAHAAYLDILLMLCQTAKLVNKGKIHPLVDTRFVKTLMADPTMAALANRYQSQSFDLKPLEEDLAAKISESPIFKNFIKKKDNKSGNEDVMVWDDIYQNFVRNNPELTAIMDKREYYSPKGLDRAKEYVEETFRTLYSSQGNMEDVLKSLKKSLEKARELYFRLLNLPVELVDLRERELDEARHKYLVSDEDRNPNLKFVENQLVEKLRDDPEISSYFESNKYSWNTEQPEVMRSLLNAVKNSEIYKEYMQSSVNDFKDDCEFWRNIFRQVVFTNKEFLEMLEDTSVFWNDDLENIGTFVLKTFRRFEEKEFPAENSEYIEEPVLSMYKDEEDARFGEELFRFAVKGRNEYRQLIEEITRERGSWEMQRLALMDVVIMVAALAEAVNFPGIPLKATINEYIEMARYYSTPKSAQFVHGVLASAIGRLQEEGKILKKV